MLLVLFAGYWLLQITTCCSFHAPTESMAPAILPGDYGLVNKWKIGARIFDIPKAIAGQKVKVHRLPGYGTIKRNDIVVFNYPLLGKDTIGMNMRTYYCKRIIAIPGDTMEIRDCRYQVRGENQSLGNVTAQIELNRWLQRADCPEKQICLYTWPYDTIMGWTISDFGPLVIPKKGTKIVMTRENVVIYGRYIAWEKQCDAPVWYKNAAWIDNNRIITYKFCENYYFAAGDAVANSADSRYWGLLPEPMIVGTADFLWDSKEPETGKRRWSRIFTSLTGI